MFSELGGFLITLREQKLTPILGGDMNCRFGNLNQFMADNRLLYEENIDVTSNKHGLTYGKDLCMIGNIFPINHLIYRGKVFDGDYTYLKGNKKSQIDFIYTNADGLKIVKNFSIQKDDWHLSDHRSILLEINARRMFNSSCLLKRAKELNYEFNPNRPVIVRHLGAYNLDLLAEYLRDNERMQEDVLDELSNCNITNAVIKFDCHLHDALRVAKIKKTRPGNNAPKIAMGKANEEFDNYLKSLKGESSESQEEALKKYQVARKRVTSSMCTIEHNKWKSLVDNNNSKKLWERID